MTSFARASVSYTTTPGISDHYSELVRRSSFFGDNTYFSDQLLPAVLTPQAQSIIQMAERPSANLVGDDAFTDMGKFLRMTSAGRDFIDLGCGKPSKAKAPRLLAQLLDCRSYTGVDVENVNNEQLIEKLPDGRDFESLWVQSDMLEFLCLRPILGAVFYLSGLEPINLESPRDSNQPISKRQINRDYIAAVLHQIARICLPDGLLLMGHVTHAFVPEENSFRLLISSERHRLYAVENIEVHTQH